MIRFLLVVVVLLGFLILSIPLLIAARLTARKNPEKMQRRSLRVVQAVFRLIIRLTGTKVTVIGQENIPDQAVLYVGNHRGYFDILVGYTTVPNLTGFVAKKEMLRYPLLSDWMRNVNCLFLDRKNIKEGMKMILTGVDKIRHGISIWIFPEGTRSEHVDLLELLPFKEGSLKIAEKAKCPVIPVAITGTSEIFEDHLPFMKPSRVTIEYGKPIDLEQLTPEERKRAGAYTRTIILEMLKAERERRR